MMGRGNGRASGLLLPHRNPTCRLANISLRIRDAKPGQWFGQQKVRLRFEIVEPAASAGIEVFLYSTLPKHPSQRHKYYELWVKANGSPPDRNDRMSSRAFRGYWKICIAWSVPKNGGHPMPQVTELLERVAGG